MNFFSSLNGKIISLVADYLNISWECRYLKLVVYITSWVLEASEGEKTAR